MPSETVIIQKRNYVAGPLTELVRAAKGEKWSLAYMTNLELALKRGVDTFYGEEVVMATAPNGAKYYINVSADSLLTTAYDVIKLLQYK